MNIVVTGVVTADVKTPSSGSSTATNKKYHESKWGIFFVVLLVVMGVICMAHIITDKGNT